MKNVTVRLVVVCVVAAAIILMQMVLSGRKNKWLGLILPASAFAFSLLYPLNLVSSAKRITSAFMAQLLFTWVMANIPTMILLKIYFVRRRKNKRESEEVK